MSQGRVKANKLRQTLFLRYSIFLNISSEKKWNHARIRRGDDWRILPQQAKFKGQTNVATRRLESVRIQWNSKKFIWKTMKVISLYRWGNRKLEFVACDTGVNLSESLIGDQQNFSKNLSQQNSTWVVTRSKTIYYFTVKRSRQNYGLLNHQNGIGAL